MSHFPSFNHTEWNRRKLHKKQDGSDIPFHRKEVSTKTNNHNNTNNMTDSNKMDNNNKNNKIKWIPTTRAAEDAVNRAVAHGVADLQTGDAEVEQIVEAIVDVVLLSQIQERIIPSMHLADKFIKNVR